MNTLVIICALVGSCIADDYSTHKDDYGGYGSVGHNYGQVGHVLGGGILGAGGGGSIGGGLGGAGGLVGGGLGGLGGLGGAGGPGGIIGGGAGGNVPIAVSPKYGTCPFESIFNPLELGPFCSNDEHCHGVQKCCRVLLNGYRCQVPREYQKPGSCNTHYIIIGGRRLACNHDTTCPFGGKCCRRASSGQS
eukprot:XP_011432686.1 PREDICTED: peroxidase-like protein 2 [Crassostrea gigas]